MIYTNIIDTVLTRFPIVKQKYIDEGDHIWGLPYLCFSFVFVPYIREVVENNDIEEITQICDFLEEMALCEDGEVRNLLGVGVFEDILSERSLVAMLKKHLKSKTKEALLSFEKLCGW